MKGLKKLTSVFLSLVMLIGTMLSYGFNHNISYATQAQSQDTLTLPITIRDAHMDGFIFEHANSKAFGEPTTKLWTGLVQDTLDKDNKVVYSSKEVTYNGRNYTIGIPGLAQNIKTSLQNNSVGTKATYKKLLNALRDQVTHSNNVYTLGTPDDEKVTSFDKIETCYQAAYWMTYYMFRDDGTFTYDGETQYLTKTVDSYNKLVLNNENGVYSFSASTSNEPVLYDEDSGTIQNGGNETRGGFFPLNNMGFGHEDQNKNFAYTLESSGKFVYRKDENLYFNFLGDDDVYLFINKKLALDIGGQHSQESGSVDLNELADYLGLEEGGIYDFNFFYVERHTSEANLGIETNIRVYDPEAVPQKNAYVGDEQIPYGGYVAQGTQINYEFVLTNNGKVNIKDLTFRDDKLKDISGNSLYLSKDSIILNSETNIADLTVSIEGVNPTPITRITSKEQLQNFLANGIKVGQTIKIKGFKYTLGSDKVKNIMKYTATSVDDSKTIDGERDNIVIPVASSDKAFIIDFGKPVTYSYDDVFNSVTDSTSHEVSLTTGIGDYGTMTNNTSGRSITYKLTKFMEGIDTFRFNETIKTVPDNGEQDNEEIVYNRQTNVKMIPGTSIYYEDNFASSGIDDASGNNTADGNNGIKYSSNWKPVDATEVSEVKGDGNIGYDSSYEGNALQHSGTMHKVTSTSKLETANFTFKGTGVDIYSYTNATTGKVSMKVYEQNPNGTYPTRPVFTKTFDTKYNSGEAYQLPVIKFNSGKTTPSRYKVTLTIPKKSTFYLDGIRIYNPIGNDNANYGDEVGSSYVFIRDESLKQPSDAKFTVSGNVFIDKYLTNDAHSVQIGPDQDLTEYTNYGRKTEVVVAPGQTITITLKNLNQYLSSKDGVYKTQIGARINAGAPDSVMNILSEEQKEQLDGKVYVNGNDIKLNSSTDMYYDVVSTNTTITIKNNSNNLISLTNLKLK